MAKKRMFALSVIDTDLFLEMPSSAQNLYFHLGVRADDDGFVGNPKKISRLIGASEDDIRILIAKKFVIPFETGVIVIKHWKLNNYLRKDRYEETIYKDEKSMLKEDENGVYSLISEIEGKLGTPLVDQNETIGLPSIDKVSIDKNSIKENKEKKKEPKSKFGEYGNVLLTQNEHTKLQKDFSNWEELIKFLDEYIEMKGYKAKSHYLCIRNWVDKAVKERKAKDNKTNPKSNYYSNPTQSEFDDLSKFYCN